MATPEGHEELYWRVRARILGRHFAVGTRSRVNIVSSRNSMGGILPDGLPADVVDTLLRWNVTVYGDENPLLWSSRLLAAVAVEHQLGHPQAERIAVAALDTFDSLYRFRRGDDFDGYVLRWDPVISSRWVTVEGGEYSGAFLVDPEREEYLYCTPHRDPRHTPTRSPETLERLLSRVQREQYLRAWQAHDHAYRSWEPSMDEIVGLVASYAVLHELIPTPAVRSRVTAQVTRLAAYLAEHAYLLVRPDGGLTTRGSTGVLPALEHPLARVFERITGTAHPARTDFPGAMRKAGYWDQLQGPVDKMAAGVVIAQLAPSSLPAPWVNGGEFVATLLHHVIVAAPAQAPPAIQAALPMIQAALPRSLGLYAHRDIFDVDQQDEPAVAHLLMALPPALRLRVLADVLTLVPSSGLEIVRGLLPHLGVAALGDPDPLVASEYLRLMADWRLRPPAPDRTDRLDSCFASAVALLHGMGAEEEARLVELLNLRHDAILAAGPECLAVSGDRENVDPGLDYLAGLALAWLYARRRAGAGIPVITPGFPVPPSPRATWPGVPLPGEVRARLPWIAGLLGVPASGGDVDLFDGPVTTAKPAGAPLVLPPNKGFVPVDRAQVFVRDTAGDVPTGITLEPGDELEITATGTITAPEFLAAPSDAGGWYVVDDARFPLHSGLDPVSARKYALLGRLGGYFFAGTHYGPYRFVYDRPLPLYLRVNIDDHTRGAGRGGFNVRIEVRGTPRQRGAAFQVEVPDVMEAGSTHRVTVMFLNRGSAWELSDGYRIVPCPGSDPVWSAGGAPLTAPVAPHGLAVFTLDVTAPATLGTFQMGWTLIGGASPDFAVTSPLRAVQVVTPR
ncbi:hypothetical protein [Sphaerisporangium aureirubrum]|uniref:Uncharacterized protein n=1 Tax=Sphaerisporangium aureirubrum TaxID=1544736 RepID=A0ABW1NSU6_9ACTN